MKPCAKARTNPFAAEQSYMGGTPVVQKRKPEALECGAGREGSADRLRACHVVNDTGARPERNPHRPGICTPLWAAAAI